jgi:hypothetical protein
MAEAMFNTTRRVLTPITILLMAIALVAALALGFGLRAWTQDSPSPAVRTVVVHDPAPGYHQPICHVGSPC